MRMLDAYLNLGIKEVNYYSLGEWSHKKSNFGAHFPNLPYLVDGDFVITETEAINQYLAQKAGRLDLMGNDAKETAQYYQVNSVIKDIMDDVMLLMFTKNDNRQEYAELSKKDGRLAMKANGMSKFLGEKEFLLGRLTILDFNLTQRIRFLEAVAFACEGESLFATHNNVRLLVKRVESLPGIKELIEKRKYVPYTAPKGYYAFTLPSRAEMESTVSK